MIIIFPAFKLFKINRNEVGNDFKFSFNVIQKWSKTIGVKLAQRINKGKIDI